jgi:hypothetical protein
MMRSYRPIVVAAVCAMVVVGALMLVFDPWYLGISSQGCADDATPVWYGEDAQSEYDELADALLSGSVALPEQPPAWLATMDNPYDPDARDAMEAATGQPYRWDAAYHDGRYYVYFGIVPCLAYFVPFHALSGGALLPTGVPVLLSLWIYLAGLAAAIGYAARHLFVHARSSVVLLSYAGAAISSGLMLAFMNASLYQIPVTASMALAVWGLYAWMRAYAEGRMRFFAIGAACIALILGCRPPLAIVAVLGLIPLGRTMGADRRAGCIALGVMAVPFVIVGMALGWYNAVRFGSPLDFGAGYNLTVVDMANHVFAWDRLPSGLWNYLLQPPVLSTVFPFLQAADLGAAWAAGSYVEPMAGGVMAAFPFLWLAGFAFCVRNRRVKATVAILVGCGVLLAALDAEMGGAVGRYQLDFAFLFALAAAVAAIAASHESEAAALAGNSRSNAERAVPVLSACTTIAAAVFAIAFILFLTTPESEPTGSGYAAASPSSLSAGASGSEDS